MKPQLVMQDHLQTGDCGVYRIVNTVTQEVYIGSSVAIRERWVEHRRQLRNGIHVNRHLLCSWRVHGDSAFIHEVLVSCSAEERLGHEQWWIDYYMAEYGKGKMFNQAVVAGVPMGKRSHTEEARARIGAAQKGNKHSVGRIVSIETRLKKSILAKGKPHPHKGHRISDAAKAKISAANKGRKMTMENAFLGKKHTEESKAKMRLFWASVKDRKTKSL